MGRYAVDCLPSNWGHFLPRPSPTTHAPAGKTCLCQRHVPGIIHYYSAALGSDLLGDEALAEMALRAAEGICDTFNAQAQMIPLGAEAQVKGTKVKGDEKGAVDNAMVPLMVVWWTWRRTGHPRFAEVAMTVAEQVCRWFIRSDGSTWQVGYSIPRPGSCSVAKHFWVIPTRHVGRAGNPGCCTGLRTRISTGSSRGCSTLLGSSGVSSTNMFPMTWFPSTT